MAEFLHYAGGRPSQLMAEKERERERAVLSDFDCPREKEGWRVTALPTLANARRAAGNRYLINSKHRTDFIPARPPLNYARGSCSVRRLNAAGRSFCKREGPSPRFCSSTGDKPTCRVAPDSLVQRCQISLCVSLASAVDDLVQTGIEALWNRWRPS